MKNNRTSKMLSIITRFYVTEYNIKYYLGT